MEKPPKIVGVLTTFPNIVWHVEGAMKKRPGLKFPIVNSDTEVIKYWRTTKNGKGRLYLVIW